MPWSASTSASASPPRAPQAAWSDQAERLAAGRRRRRIEATPLPLRPQVQAFAESLLRARERARRAGALPRTDTSIDAALAIIRDLALFLASTRDKQDWSLTDVHDVEAFLANMPKARQRRLTVLRSTSASLDPAKSYSSTPPAESRRKAPPGSAAPPSPSTSSASCSAAGPPAPTRTRTRPCWEFWLSSARPPAAKSDSYALTISTPPAEPSAWANGRIRSLWTRLPGQ
ncbi:hypothetical protein Slala03_77600 [Streptomyces lavendulae subsp. lavendulae]|nr:hypothetical protein Slala03_77600 [Streptomyces lavendulae subsp. lavendulae]